MILFKTINNELIDLEKITFISIQSNIKCKECYLVANFGKKIVYLDDFEDYKNALNFLDKLIRLFETKYEVTDYEDIL